MTAAELALLLKSPVPAILNATPSLLRAGFPPPTRAANGQLLWRRVEVAAHLADAGRLAVATAAARQGMVGVPFHIDGGTAQAW